MNSLLDGYDPHGFYCELLGSPAFAAEHTQVIRDWLSRTRPRALRKRAQDCERELYNLGITFTVYSERDSIDRVLPFDVVPRPISATEWAHLERGLVQRVTAMNLFLRDVYGPGQIFRDGIIPAHLVKGNENYRPEMADIDVPFNSFVNICGVDLVRGGDGIFRVLEDNARTPSGVSYVVENRHLMLRAFPDLMSGVGIRPVSDYGIRLRDALAEMAPAAVDDAQIVLMSPGSYNSAYFEHVFLAREMGVPLVEGQDLEVVDGLVYMKTTAGPKRVDVIYRRIGDDFLDPLVFRSDSILGVAGIMDVYRKGRVTLANAVGTGVADDKAVYAYMPRIIKYYLDQEALIPNVETHICGEPEALRFTLDNLENLVVKPVGESGGYGVVVGSKASLQELADCRALISAHPENYISQPIVDLSVCPTLVDGGLAARHVDLRPFLITGKSTWVLPGGLTRVALKEGSLIVNSSQGGGTKDTWVLE
ncbi:MAG: circularly permuted type 2 ATP-grasp protein [Rhodospirillales bacterium]|nr:circularly permuted type 2 ATP-grasp protein [Rhodospirillales bacterium]